jgi:hypothetical protein
MEMKRMTPEVSSEGLDVPIVLRKVGSSSEE